MAHRINPLGDCSEDGTARPTRDLVSSIYSVCPDFGSLNDDGVEDCLQAEGLRTCPTLARFRAHRPSRGNSTPHPNRNGTLALRQGGSSEDLGGASRVGSRVHMEVL